MNTQTKDILAAAEAYCKLKWRILPLVGKKPTLDDWPTEATNVFDNMSWRLAKSGINIGIATGKGSGIVVIDIDPPKGGDKTFADLETQLGKLPDTVEAISGGDGRHLIFKFFDGAKSSSSGGIDFLADGRQVVVTPSVHPRTKNRYQWLHSPFERSPAELPLAWQTHFSKNASKTQGLLKKPDFNSNDIPEGKRNITLTSIAGKLKSDGKTIHQIRIHLFEENAIRCKPKLTDEEIERIVLSISKYANNASLKTNWQRAVLHDPSMPHVKKLILMALVDFADVDGRSCHPTQQRLAEMVPCTRKSVGIYLKEAVKEGWMVRFTHPRKTGKGFSHSYRLRLKDEYGVHILNTESESI